MSNKMWEALLDHAKTCVLSGKLYVYYTDDSRNVGVVFNNIFELNGLISGEQYFPTDSLSDSQKVGKIYAVFHLLMKCNIYGTYLLFKVYHVGCVSNNVT